MKVALVHDYLREFGGAERVLAELAKFWPEAPIYTAFIDRRSSVGRYFAQRQVVESKYAPVLNRGNLYSPFRFLAPAIWRSFDLREYDLVISSASWYLTKGFRVGKKTKIVCYCHTPPRWLYGYPTSVNWQRYWPVRVYGQIVAHYLRMADFEGAQQVDLFVANSENVRGRIKKFYRRDSEVVYPPVAVKAIEKATRDLKPQDYYLIVSRVVGAKGIELALEAARQGKFKLKIAGETAGLQNINRKLANLPENIKFLGRLSDEELYQAYGRCRAFLALSEDEDFGITPVEAMAAGRPVIAFKGGGYLETVVEGQTGLFFNNRSVEGLLAVVGQFEKGERSKFRPEACRRRARKFQAKSFRKEFEKIIEEVMDNEKKA